MIIYNPDHMLHERLIQAEQVLKKISVKYCLITGSFLFKKKYEDIDVFIVSRSKKIETNHPVLDFNDLHSLFYHSISKCCIAKNILPSKELKVTLTEYWNIINETIPTILNNKNDFQKDIRSLILYTKYLSKSVILDSPALYNEMLKFPSYKDVLLYINKTVPVIYSRHASKGYLKRFFYTLAGHYKSINYDAQKYLYELTHRIVAYG